MNLVREFWLPRSFSTRIKSHINYDHRFHGVIPSRKSDSISDLKYMGGVPTSPPPFSPIPLGLLGISHEVYQNDRAFMVFRNFFFLIGIRLFQIYVRVGFLCWKLAMVYIHYMFNKTIYDLFLVNHRNVNQWLKPGRYFNSSLLKKKQKSKER